MSRKISKDMYKTLVKSVGEELASKFLAILLDTLREFVKDCEGTGRELRSIKIEFNNYPMFSLTYDFDKEQYVDKE